MAQAYTPEFGSSTELTITLDSLTSSDGGKTVNHAALVDNTTVKAKRIRVYVKAKLASTGRDAQRSSENVGIHVWGFRFDAATPNISTDGIAATAATGIAIVNAEYLGYVKVPLSNGGQTVQGMVFFEDPGPAWTIGIGQNTGAALAPPIPGEGEDPDTSAHLVHYVAETNTLAASA